MSKIKVFVNAYIEGVQDWDEVDIKDADPSKIIKCFQCDKPATRLDHYYPYHSELNLCDDHKDNPKGGEDE
jgi:hypothetical protein